MTRGARLRHCSTQCRCAKRGRSGAGRRGAEAIQCFVQHRPAWRRHCTAKPGEAEPRQSEGKATHILAMISAGKAKTSDTGRWGAKAWPNNARRREGIAALSNATAWRTDAKAGRTDVNRNATAAQKPYEAGRGDAKALRSTAPCRQAPQRQSVGALNYAQLGRSKPKAMRGVGYARYTTSLL